MLPAAPALFSTTTACFQTLPSASAMMRGRMSAVPPAGLGTMILTAEAGKASPAHDVSYANRKPKLAGSVTSRRAGFACIRHFPSAVAPRIGAAGVRQALAWRRPPYPQARLRCKSSLSASETAQRVRSELHFHPAVDGEGRRGRDGARIF